MVPGAGAAAAREPAVRAAEVQVGPLAQRRREVPGHDGLGAGRAHRLLDREAREQDGGDRVAPYSGRPQINSVGS